MPKIVDREAKRQEIIEAATAVFAREGFAATKISDVAEQAQVAKGSVYQYFESKAELFIAVCQNLVNWPDEAEPFLADPVKGLEKLIYALAESYERSADFFVVLLDYWAVLIRGQEPYRQYFRSMGETFYAHPRRLLTEVVQRGRERKVFRKSADPAQVASLAIAGIEGLRMQQMHDPKHVDMKRSLQMLVRVLRDSITPDGAG